MNLNKTHREEIVAQVMRDTPKRHKLSLRDRLQAVIDKAIIERGPKIIGPLWKDKELGRYLNRTSTSANYLRSPGDDRYVAELPYVSTLYGYVIDDEATAEIASIIDDHVAEQKLRDAAESALRGAIAGIRTRKQFIEQFPELEKYAPSVVTADRSVPAIANVMALLAKTGWPADAKVGAA